MKFILIFLLIASLKVCVLGFPKKIPELTQAHTIQVFNGVVTGQEDQALPGVSVVVEATQRGTTTDESGSFSIDANPGDILVFSMIGYRTLRYKTGTAMTINIKLEPEIFELDNVGVGFGTMRKRDLTDAVSKVNLQQQSELSNVTFLQSMQGSIPGLNIGPVTASGETPSITIRGQNTLSSSYLDNLPLIVIDGIIYRGSMADNNPADIESVEVLKDASSASIYGSQAANGIILITSKKGLSRDKPVISYSGQYSIQAPARNIKPLQGKAYEKFMDDLYWNQSRLAPDYISSDPNFDFGSRLKNAAITDGYLNGRDNNWWNMLTGNGYKIRNLFYPSDIMYCAESPNARMNEYKNVMFPTNDDVLET